MTKWEIDQRKYRTALERKHAAERFGAMAVGHMLLIRDNAQGNWPMELPQLAIDRAEEDAIMFARMAYRGWRALQMVDHEVN